MKKIYKRLIILIVIILTFTLEVYAHGGNITGWKDKDSSEIVVHNGSYYGYHNEDGKRHYHEVEWNKEKQRWDILKTAVYYDSEFNKVERNLSSNEEKIKVEFYDFVDGDTAKFKVDGKVITARFLGINTPETVAQDVPVQEWGPEASDYTKNTLKNATKIEIEYDEKASKKDKYDRDLVWVWVDDKLLQEQIVMQGLAEQYMLPANYRYADVIQEAESIAKENRVGIWSGETGETKEEAALKEENNQESDSIIIAMGTAVLGVIAVVLNKWIRSLKKKR